MHFHEMFLYPSHLMHNPPFPVVNFLWHYRFRVITCLMESSGSSPESNHPHRRRDLGRTSRSRDTRPHTHIEEVDYDDDDEHNPLPSTNPPPGTEIARGAPDPPQPSDTATGDTSHPPITSPGAVSGPPLTPRPHHVPCPRPHSTPAFPPSPPAHLTGPLFPPPRIQAPRPRPPLSHPCHGSTTSQPVRTTSAPQATTFFPGQSHFADNTIPFDTTL